MNVQELPRQIGLNKREGDCLNILHGGSFYRAAKRAADIVFSAAALVLLSPLMIIIGLIVRADSSGCAIFRQERLGLRGRPFMIYKFRSMITGAEKAVPLWADKNDSRVTRVGAFLRKTRLDELPQLFNILVGDMSFVGPRPEREYFYGEFEKTIPLFRKRLLVKPGLTGLAQVNGGYDISPEEKWRYDMRYIKSMSLHGDILIMFKTVRVIFTGRGAR